MAEPIRFYQRSVLRMMCLFRSAPLIFVSTILTHFAGGSAGREGAAIQLGGSIGNQLGSWFHLDEEDRHVMVMCGMSAAFSAVFGTPMAAAVFSMEVVSVGIMYYAALVPLCDCIHYCLKVCGGLWHQSGIFSCSQYPGTYHRNRTQDGSCCRCLCCHQYYFLYGTSGCQQTLCEIFKKSIYPYRRSQCIIIVITLFLRTSDYMGAGNNLIELAVENGQARPLDFSGSSYSLP